MISIFILYIEKLAIPKRKNLAKNTLFLLPSTDILASFAIILQNIARFSFHLKKKQECSCQGEVLNVPTALWGLWSSN